MDQHIGGSSSGPPNRKRMLNALTTGTRPSDVSREHPHREIALGLGVAALFFVVFLGWAAVAHLDAGVYAPGEIEVSGNRQTVQHRDGGIVRELDVHDGDRVRTGQVLLRLRADELQANERATATQVIEQKALQARLMAELTGAGTIDFPRDITSSTGDDKIAADNAMKLQRLEFSRRGAALSIEREILANQAGQGSEQVKGYARQISANREEQGLIGDEIGGLKPLLQRGLVPMTRLHSLQRSQAELKGAEGEYSADVARTQQEIGEKRIRMQDLVSERDADDTKEYRAAELQLADLEPKLAATREQISRTEVRAPATGQVVGLTIFTVGGVIAPGQKLMDVVPENEPLVIQAKVKPSDAEDLHVGQSTEIRISAFHDRNMPILHGVIATVGADALSEEKTGQPYFLVKATVPPSELKTITRVRGADSGLRPGLPVEMVVPLHARTALDYLVDPLRHMLWKSFREH